MATLPRWTIQDPQNVLDTFGAGALSRLERDTTSAMTTAAEVTTVAVVAGTTEHEYRDQTGVAGTHYYRLRFSTASPTLAAHYSGYGAVFQAGAPAGEVITVETVKTWTSISDTTDDGWLSLAVASMNRAIVRMVSVDLGSSPDTTRTYRLGKGNGDRLTTTNETRRPIPGGIRSFTTIEVSEDASAWTTVTTDMTVGPAVFDRTPGEPGSYIEFNAYTTIESSFSGWEYVRITGTAFKTFGYDAYPADLVQAGLSAMQRMMADRDGRGQFPTETDAMRYLNPATLAYFRGLYFPMVG